MSKKKFLIDIDPGNRFYKLLDEYRIERELSLTAAIKQLLFQKLDEIDKESLRLNTREISTKQIEVVETKEKIKEEKPKKDMLKNLSKIKSKLK